MVAIAITTDGINGGAARDCGEEPGRAGGAAARQMLALALVVEGVDRKTAAVTCGMDR